MRSSALVFLPVLVLVSILLIIPGSAIYDFEGIPLTIGAQGEVNGEILTFGNYGLANPPYQLSFELPANPRYARVYTGIWGGTEKYTGRADLRINNLKKITYTLYGDRDQNRDVYMSGHGIYWISYDATDLLKKGNNVITVNTSKGEPGNKLDGRVYCIFVVAAVESPGNEVTRYWIAEGNENLHGAGWAGTNPTKHEEANVTFTGAAVSGISRANLTVLLLAGGNGQPDYVEFNGKGMGVPVKTVNGISVTDIGNEKSFDATGVTGFDSRYVDAETFDVNDLVQETNTVRFLRGNDLNGDGVLETTGDNQEAEDYIHPVVAILAITKPGTSQGPDLAAGNIRLENGYEGETALLTAEIRNYGSAQEGPASVVFSVDGKTVNTTSVSLPKSGIADVSVPWPATGGTVTISAEVTAAGDAAPGNNRASRQITIATPPDLSISVGTPVRKDDSAGVSPTQAPLSVLPAVAGFAAIVLFRRRGPGSAALAVMLPLTLMMGAAVVVPAGAVSDMQEYTLPLEITNSGGSDAPPFAVTVYLDGEKIAEKRIDDGIKAHGSLSTGIPVFTTPGSHTLKITVDESGQIKDQNRANNLVQGTYVFPR